MEKWKLEPEDVEKIVHAQDNRKASKSREVKVAGRDDLGEFYERH